MAKTPLPTTSSTVRSELPVFYAARTFPLLGWKQQKWVLFPHCKYVTFVYFSFSVTDFEYCSITADASRTSQTSEASRCTAKYDTRHTWRGGYVTCFLLLCFIYFWWTCIPLIKFLQWGYVLFSLFYNRLLEKSLASCLGWIQSFWHLRLRGV